MADKLKPAAADREVTKAASLIRYYSTRGRACLVAMADAVLEHEGRSVRQKEG